MEKIYKEKIAKTRENTDLVELKLILETLSKKYNKTPFELITHIENKILIPISLFKQEKPLTAVVTFIIENHKLSYTQIGKILNRSTKTIWQAYNNTQTKKENQKKKISQNFTQYERTRFDIPVEYFYKNNLSILETVVTFLKEEHKLTYKKISSILFRDQRTIWTIYNRAISKNKTIKKLR